MDRPSLIKTTFHFEPSPDLEPCGEGNGHVVLTIIDGQRQPEFLLPPRERQVSILAPAGSAVQIFIAYRDTRGVQSPAREVRFRVREQRTPLPPGELKMISVETLPSPRTIPLPVLT
jgi:hypothetical protein